jgi:ectoine hydroxylase-related dioxygenase (phytanoyl-CoA dioxygenase family)
MNSHSSDDGSASTDSNDENVNRVTAHDGLSLETLQMLQEFQQHGCFMGNSDKDDTNDINDDDDDDGNDDKADTDKASAQQQVIDDTCKRLELAAEEAAHSHRAALQLHGIPDLVDSLHSQEHNDESRAAYLLDQLKTTGVVRINNVLTDELVAECLTAINVALTEPNAITAQQELGGPGFGNVYSRPFRYDMYLRPVQQYEAALQAMLSEHAVLGQLFDAWLQGKSGVFHEFSALVADPGADSQPIHPDARYSLEAPMLTVFCALQDVTADMGPTVFVPASHSAAAHDSFTASVVEKDAMLAAAEYRQACLKAGDVAVMDARLLHFGSANVSDTRRTLLYFTIRNPAHGTTNADFPECGSLFPDLQMTTSDYRCCS